MTAHYLREPDAAATAERALQEHLRLTVEVRRAREVDLRQLQERQRDYAEPCSEC